jgi:hypothetical protein
MAGKNQALFKPFLFADQDLDTLVADISPKGGALAEAAAHLRAGNPGEAAVVLGSAILTAPGEVTGWHRLLLAAAQRRNGNPAAAVRTLKGVLAAEKDSRLRLWTFTALRALDATPAEDGVEGVVLEVEGGHGVETLAAYADGSARYLLPTGARVIWDAPDQRLEKVIAAVIAGAAAIVPHTAPGKLAGEPGTGMARMTLLLPSGLRAVEEPLAAVIQAEHRLAPLFAPATTLLEQVCAIAKW